LSVRLLYWCENQPLCSGESKLSLTCHCIIFLLLYLKLKLGFEELGTINGVSFAVNCDVGVVFVSIFEESRGYFPPPPPPPNMLAPPSLFLPMDLKFHVLLENATIYPCHSFYVLKSTM
jgi:hypothetical protein